MSVSWPKLQKEAKACLAGALNITKQPMDSALEARRLPHLAELVEREAVRKARKDGATWAEIGNDLGMTKQAAWERYTTGEDNLEEDADKKPRRIKAEIKLTCPEAEVVADLLQAIADGRTAEGYERAAAALGTTITERVEDRLQAINESAGEGAYEKAENHLANVGKALSELKSRTTPAKADPPKKARSRQTKTSPSATPPRSKKQPSPKPRAAKPKASPGKKAGSPAPRSSAGSPSAKTAPRSTS